MLHKKTALLFTLILADVKRSLYDAMPNKCWFPFVIISFVFGRSGRPPGGAGLEV